MISSGRISESGFISKNPVPNRKHKDVVSTRGPLPPDEVIFQRREAPIRFAETDQYFSHRHLSSQLPLPDSDLLTAIHAYVAHYCSTMSSGDSYKAWRSMDETALLAMGILVEEAVRDALGGTGDLAFVEGDINDGPSSRTNQVGASGRDESDIDFRGRRDST
jgi:hypothetical protein